MHRAVSLTSFVAGVLVVVGLSTPGLVHAEEETEIIQHEGLPPVESSDEASSDEESTEQSDQADDQSDEQDGETSDKQATDKEEETGSDMLVQAGYGVAIGVDTRWDGSGEDIAEWSARTNLKLQSDFGEHWRAVVAGELNHWVGAKENDDGPTLLINGDDPRAALRPELRESYVLRRADNWTFRAGHLVTSWGSTSLVQPSNVVNPSDLTDIASATTGGSTVRPQPAVEASWQQSSWSLQGVVVPFFVPNRVAVIGRDTAVASPDNPAVSGQFPVFDVLDDALDPSLYDEAQPLLLATSVPDERPKNVSAGLRWSGTFANTDLGASYFFGWDRTPFIEVDEDVRALVQLVVEDGQVLEDYDFAAFFGRHPEAAQLQQSISESAEAGETLISSTYRRRHTIGIDASRYIGPIGVRLDVAFSPEKTFLTDELASVRRPMVYGALGLSYERLTGGHPLVVNLEPFVMKPFDADAGVTELFVSESERGDSSDSLLLVGDAMAGTALAVQWELPWWSLTADFAGYGTVTNRDVVASLGLTREWSPAINTGIRGILYEGPDPGDELSVGGLYDRNDQLLMTVSGQF